jgi:murein L,D-transpeptidase YcbB/YkuD
MRKFLLATSAAALALAFSGQAHAELAKTPVAAAAVAPLEATSADALVFSKDAEQAKPMDPAGNPEASQGQAEPPAKSTGQPAPDMVTTTLNGQAAQTQAAETQAVNAEDAAVADRLRNLAENKLQQYVPHAQDRAGVLAFYRARNFAPIWVGSGKPAPRVEQATAFLKGVAADGLDPADYPAPGFADADPAKLAADEMAMTNSVVSFARHASIGRVAFTRVSGAVYYDQKAPNAADVLGQVVASSDLRATLDAFNPQAPEYKALKQQLAAVRSGLRAEPKTELKSPSSEPTIIKEGKAKSKKKGHAEQDKIKEAKPKTASPDTIIANMERWRWMPHDLGATYVMVNIPDYTLKVVKDGRTIWTTKIVVGKPGDHATPLLTETMKYITVNPTWNVPPSIIRNEYLPALARDPGALARIGLQVGRNRDGSIRIFQPPGERNALGRIRFNFPNRFLVYQHDTPDKKLFAHDARAYSHGCMRVQNPDEYAEVLLGVSQPDDKYTAARIRAMYGSSERTISFKRPIPVYITYQTAFVDAGKPQTRADIYGLDRDLLNVLHSDRRTSDTPIARNYNSRSKPVMSSAAPSRARSSNSGARSSNYASNPGYATWNGTSSWTAGFGGEVRSASQPWDRRW